MAVSATRVKRDRYRILHEGISTGIEYSLHYHRPFLEPPSFPMRHVRIVRADGTVFSENAGDVRQDSQGRWDYRPFWQSYWASKTYARREDAAARLLVETYCRTQGRTR